MDIYVQATIGPCTEFTLNKEKEEISIVIAPLKIIFGRSSVDHPNGESLKFNSGCNMWRACENPACQYSLISRPEKKTAGD